MGWEGYVPEEALKKWGEDSTMKEHLWQYGMTRKHGADKEDAEILCLLGTIDSLQKEVLKLKEQLAYQETYFQNAISKLNGPSRP